MKKIEYWEVNQYSKDEILKKISSNNLLEIGEAILSSSSGNNYQLALSLLDKFYQHSNDGIRKICIDSLIRVVLNYKKIDAELAVKIIRSSLIDKNKSIKGAVMDCISDLEHNLENFKFDYCKDKKNKGTLYKRHQ